MHIFWVKSRTFFTIAVIVTSISLISLPVVTNALSIDALQSLDENIEANPFSEEDQLIIESQAPALEAFELFMDDISRDKDGNPKYPENLGGLYLEDGCLVISYVGSDYKNLQRIDFSKFPVKYKKVDYSYNYLNKLLTVAKENIPNWNQLYVDQEENQAVANLAIDIFQLSKLTNFRDHISKQEPFDVSKDKINFLIDNADFFGLESFLDIIGSDIDAFDIRFDPPLIEESELWGGDIIAKQNPSGSSSLYTLGATGYYAGSPAIVTAGHGNLVSNTFTYNGTRIGNVIWRGYGLGDYSIIKLSQTDHNIVNKYFGAGGAGAAPISISGTKSELLKNEVVYKYGITSGWSRLTITSPSTAVQIGGIKIYKVATTDVQAGTSKPGDSGGPYFSYRPNNKWYFIGVHGGSSTYSTHFTPYSVFESRFVPLY